MPITLPEEEYVRENGVTRCTMLHDLKHAIGMDYRKSYTRHGKKFYRPYRNFFATTSGNKEWDKLVADGLAECYIDKEVGHSTYWLTRKGLDWLGEKLGVKIYDEEK